MWAHLIKLASLSKGALVVGVAASAAMVSNAEFSNAPSHQELPSASPSALVAPATTKPTDKPTEKPSTLNTTPAASPKTEEKHGEIPQVVKDCVDKYLAIRAQGDSAPAADRQAVGDLCKAALAATGLSSGDFWAKFGFDKQTSSDETEARVTGDLEALIKECVAQYRAGTADASDACRRAIAASGLTPQEFWTKFHPYAEKPKGDLSADALAWARECVTKYTLKSTDANATCKKAIELSGLTSAEFAAKFLPRSTETKPATTPKPSTKTEPTASPKPVTNTVELSVLVAKCLDLYKAVTSTGETHAASEACGVAIRASGMSSADFWAKYHPTTN
jgi:hypothetical protein